MHPVVTDMKKAEAILAWAVRQDGRALRAPRPRRRAAHQSYNQLGEEELMERLQPENDEERQPIPHAPAVHRDRRRRDGRPDDDRRQRGRAAHHPPGAEEPGGRHPPDPGHAEADGRRHHRPDQVEPAGPDRVPGRQPHRQPRRARRDGGRQAAGQRRHAVPRRRARSTLAPRPGHVRLSDEEINRVVEYLAAAAEQNSCSELVQLKVKDGGARRQEAASRRSKKRDELYEPAIEIVIREGRGSVLAAAAAPWASATAAPPG